MVGLGRGGAGGVVQFFDKAVVALGTLVVAVQLLDKALTCPLLSTSVSCSSLVSRASVTCLLGFVWVFMCSSLVSRASLTCLLGVLELFVLVKGVGDVLAGRWSRVLTSSSQLSRASVTCLLDVELGAYGAVYGDGAVVGFFHGISAFFALLLVVPELSASFWSPR